MHILPLVVNKDEVPLDIQNYNTENILSQFSAGHKATTKSGESVGCASQTKGGNRVQCFDCSTKVTKDSEAYERIQPK